MRRSSLVGSGRLVAAAMLTAFVVLTWCASALAFIPPEPPITGLATPTHPDPARWYSCAYPAFYWQAAIAAAGYSWILDPNPGTVPGTIRQMAVLTFTRTATDPGTGTGPQAITASVTKIRRHCVVVTVTSFK